MARLPSRDDLSGPASFRSGRMISSADMSGIGRGLSSLGNSLAGIGAEYAKDEEEKRRESVVLDGATADGGSVVKLNDFERTFDTATDYDQFPTRINSGLDKIRKEQAALIRDPKAREVWEAEFQKMSASTRDRVLNLGQSRVKETRLLEAKKSLEGFQTVIADDAADEEARAGAKRSADVWISGLQESGQLTPVEADEWRDKVIRGGEFILGEKMIAKDGAAALIGGGFEGSLVKRESGGRPGIVNNLGYAGLYQFGAPRMADLGIYDPEGENLGGWSKRKGGQGKWTGTFNIPGFPEVKKIGDFLANPAAQKAAFEVHRAKMDQEIEQQGLDGFIGQTVGGVQITRDGIHAMMHLGGAGGAAKTLKSGGRINAADANGTTLLAYAKMATGESGKPDWYTNQPADKRQALDEQADKRQSQMDTETLAAYKAGQAAAKDEVSLRIASFDPTLTRDSIMTNPNLDMGDRASLLNSYNEKMKEFQQTGAAVQQFASDGLRVDPYDTEGKKTVDNVYDAVTKAVPGSLQSTTEELVRQTGVVPKGAMNLLRRGLTSTDPAAVIQAAQVAARLSAIDPSALGRRDGGSEVQDAATAFTHYKNTIGLDDAQAAQRMIDARDPLKAAARKALMDSEPVKKFVKDKATESVVRDIFDPGVFGFDPKLGDNPAQSASMVGEYKSILEESLFDAAGDTGLAKTLADQRFMVRYSPSQFSMSGANVVTRLPPEKTYSPGPDGSHDYIRGQLLEALAAEGVEPENVYLQTYENTDPDFRAGKPARYQVFYEKNGEIEMFNLPFFAVPPAAVPAMGENKARWQENRDQLEAGRDREKTLDKFLDGNPLTGGN